MGEPVALPTETVYGLAANAFNQSAVEKIFEIKGRPSHNPIIVHVCGLEMARGCVEFWPPVAGKLARAFWPGPLTLVLRRSKAIPDVVTAGGATVGIRWPAHPLMQAVIRRCGFPLAAPSANPSNRLSPTTAEHVRKALGDRLRLIIDGGPCHIGIESTVLDLTRTPPAVLRPGMVHLESLVAVAGEVETGPAQRGTLRSPGQLPKHYSPRARTMMLSWQDDQDLERQLAALNLRAASGCIIAHNRIPSASAFGRVSVIPHDREAFARAIYAELHSCDETDPDVIVIEALPETNEWRAVSDRLKRATAV
jgi:L-threonylcarbamoyladenylate synthase